MVDNKIDGVRYRNALRELEQGRVPRDIDEILKYAEDSVFETRQLAVSLTDCAKRQDRALQIIRAWVEGMKRQAARKQAAPQWVGPSAELIPGDTKEG